MDDTQFTTDEATAARLDETDPLAHFRERFFLPPGKIYMNGNSLGPMSSDGEASLKRVAQEWKTQAIAAWMKGGHPWIQLAERLGAEIAVLVGAESEEVVATGTTTVNLHSLVSTFYQVTGERTKILSDRLTFPTDIYALRSQVRLAGRDPDRHLVFVPDDGRFLDEKVIVERMESDVALVVLPSVLYRSGQLLDMDLLTREAHERGIPIGFDCSHSVGVVPHHFDRWGVDFALWCGYKYLNGGPGCPAFIYVNRSHFKREPSLAGWFGFRKAKQFDLLVDFEHEPSAGGWQISSPAMLSAAPLEGAIRIAREAGIDAIREKSLRMTAYLIFLIDALLPRNVYGFEVGTPRTAARRGGHVALEHRRDATEVFAALTARDVVADFRPPNVIRLAPVPLYNSYHEVWRVVHLIREIADQSP